MAGHIYAGALVLNILVAIASFAFMALVFNASWKISASSVWRFNGFGEVTKADWCSRINSTIHAAVVCILVVVTLSTTEFDSTTLQPVDPTILLEVTFSISIGYFLFDLIVLLWWMLPLWSVFVVHHIVALIPYVITQFFYECDAGQYVLLLFLLVEASTVPLNAMTFLEDLGLRRTKAHWAAHWTMYALWLVFRVLLPIFLLVLIWTVVVNQAKEEAICLIPSMICAHIIAAFCIGLFFFLVTPELYKRLRDGDKEEPTGEGTTYASAHVGDAVDPSSMEMGGPAAPGAEGGAYVDLGSESITPRTMPPPGRNISHVAMEGPQSMAQAFREGLLPQGDDEGGTGPTGADRSTTGQMR